jgi:hypothetical protein
MGPPFAPESSFNPYKVEPVLWRNDDSNFITTSILLISEGFWLAAEAQRDGAKA